MLREYLSNIADKFRTYLDTTEPINAQDFADKVEEVFEAGYNSAVREVTITILEITKELKIEGLPKAPKTLNLLATSTGKLTQFPEGYKLIRGLDYFADGYFQGSTSSSKRLANLWTIMSTGTAGSSSILEKDNVENNKKLIDFENGVFTFKITESNTCYYGKDFTFKWIATF